MSTNNVMHDFTDFVFARVAVAEKIFKDRREVIEAYEAYDKAYQDTFKVLEKTGQQDLLKTLTKAQVKHTSWTLQAVYLQAFLDFHKLFLPND